MRRLALVLIAPLAFITLAAMVWLWPQPLPNPTERHAAAERTGQVTAIQAAECTPGEQDLPGTGVAPGQSCGTASVRLSDGLGAGSVIRVQIPTGPGAPAVTVGDDVVLIESEGPEGTEFAIVDHTRGVGLGVLVGALALAVIGFARWRGVRALVGLAVSFAVLFAFVIPAILGGASPVTIALVGSSVIILVVLYLTHGFSLTTTVAVLGTLASLALTGLLSLLAVRGLELSGVTDDTSTFLAALGTVDMRGLLLAGILIGSLGVLDDVTVTQAATVREIADANPAYDWRRLYRAGSRVGRAHIASVINTIVLAYAGSSLPVLLMLVSSRGSFGDVITTQFISQEVVRSAVATIGLVAAVPLTTVVAAWTAGGSRVSAEEPAPRA